jgi:hypothetical protein
MFYWDVESRFFAESYKVDDVNVYRLPRASGLQNNG